jgi:hemoglobin-like flavoprotein
MLDKLPIQRDLVLSPGQRVLIRETFALLKPRGDAVAATVYTRIFELAPSLRSLFPSDLTATGDRLMRVLALAVFNLEQLETIGPSIRSMGRRHVGHGVSNPDYDTVCQALVWTLERELGTAFTPDVRDAWVTLYEILTSMMRRHKPA